MKYRIGFKNGMVVTIDAESLLAAEYNHMEFKKAKDNKEQDYDRYISSTEVLFVAPADQSYVEHLAVGPTVKPK
jgi:hypothetical protein